MIRTKTVFVVGAGASCELGFPSGGKLLEQIAQILDLQFSNGYTMDRGDIRIRDAYRQLAVAPDGRSTPINPYQNAGWQVRDAAHLGLSIDNVINQFDDQPLVAQVGKVAIARQILLAEQSSILKISRDRGSDVKALAAIRSTWLGAFAQLLVQDKQRTALDDLFENVSVISFNYDRSIRQFLPLAIRSQFGVFEEESRILAKNLPIYYPYGSIGLLPWETGGVGIEYGDADHANLIDVASRLRTFTEQIEHGESLAAMRQALGAAQRVIFLGFGYHLQNITLLLDGVVGDAARVYGTALGLSNSDKEVVGQQLNPFIKPHYRGAFPAQLEALSCTKFINEYFRTLTA